MGFGSRAWEGEALLWLEAAVSCAISPREKWLPLTRGVERGLDKKSKQLFFHVRGQKMSRVETKHARQLSVRMGRSP